MEKLYLYRTGSRESHVKIESGQIIGLKIMASFNHYVEDLLVFACYEFLHSGVNQVIGNYKLGQYT